MHISTKAGQQRKADVLFRIVGRVCYDPKIYSPSFPIWEENDKAVLISLDELLVKKETPDSVEQFSATVGLEAGISREASELSDEVLKGRRKLRRFL